MDDTRQNLNSTLHEAALDGLPVPVMVHDDHIVIYVNDAAARVLRAESRSEIEGRPVTDISHPDNRAAGEQRRHLVMENAHEFSGLDLKLLALDGGVVYVRADARRIFFGGRPAILVTATPVPR